MNYETISKNFNKTTSKDEQTILISIYKLRKWIDSFLEPITQIGNELQKQKERREAGEKLRYDRKKIAAFYDGLDLYTKQPAYKHVFLHYLHLIKLYEEKKFDAALLADELFVYPTNK